MICSSFALSSVLLKIMIENTESDLWLFLLHATLAKYSMFLNNKTNSEF